MNPCCDNPGRLRSGEDRWKENPGNPDCEGNELVRSGTMFLFTLNLQSWRSSHDASS